MTSATPSPEQQDLQNEFNLIGNYLDAVIETVVGGHMPDMAGLDKRITALCAKVEESDPDLQQTCLTKLKDLLSRLDKCEDHIRSYQDKTQDTANND